MITSMSEIMTARSGYPEVVGEPCRCGRAAGGPEICLAAEDPTFTLARQS